MCEYLNTENTDIEDVKDDLGLNRMLVFECLLFWLDFYIGCLSCLSCLANAIQMAKTTKTAFLYYCPDYQSHPANAVKMGWATWVIQASIVQQISQTIKK